jgi:hypothetical protein
MPAFRRYRKKTTKKSTKTVKGRKITRTKGVTMPIKRYVNRTIGRNIETKRIEYASGFTVSNYFNDTSLNSFWLSPGNTIQILQGDGQGMRTGNRLKITKAILTYSITPIGYDALLNPQPKPTLLRLWIGYFKTDQDNKPTDFTQLYQVGNSSGPPNNFISDIQRSVNKDKFVVYRSIIHKIGFSSVDGTGAQPVVQYYNNNDFKYLTMRKLDITKYMISNVIYNDNTAFPSTRGLFAWMQVVGADNTTMNNIIPVNFNYFIDIEYKDG